MQHKFFFTVNPIGRSWRTRKWNQITPQILVLNIKRPLKLKLEMMYGGWLRTSSKAWSTRSIWKIPAWEKGWFFHSGHSHFGTIPSFWRGFLHFSHTQEGIVPRGNVVNAPCEEVGRGADLGKEVIHGVVAVEVNGCHEEDREGRVRCREAQHKAEEEGEIVAHQASRLRHDAPCPHPAQIMWCGKILHCHACRPYVAPNECVAIWNCCPNNQFRVWLSVCLRYLRIHLSSDPGGSRDSNPQVRLPTYVTNSQRPNSLVFNGHARLGQHRRRTRNPEPSSHSSRLNDISQWFEVHSGFLSLKRMAYISFNKLSNHASSPSI